MGRAAAPVSLLIRSLGCFAVPNIDGGEVRGVRRTRARSNMPTRKLFDAFSARARAPTLSLKR